MDLTEAEDIKKRWQEYTEELYKKNLHDPDNHDGVITDLEPDILECQVKWALENITTNHTLSHFLIPHDATKEPACLRDDFVSQPALEHLLGWEREGSTDCTIET